MDYSTRRTGKHYPGTLENYAWHYIGADGYTSFSILTQEATPMLAEIHNTKNQRPVILADELVDYWLKDSLEKDDIIDVILNDLENYHFNAYPISKDL